MTHTAHSAPLPRNIGRWKYLIIFRFIIHVSYITCVARSEYGYDIIYVGQLCIFERAIKVFF